MQSQKQIQVTAKYGDDLTEFSFTSANQKVTSYLIDGKVHFVAADICKVLGYANTSDLLKRKLDEDEYLTYEIHRAGQKRDINIITESGLYHLIFQSKKPSAKTFRRFVTETILPQIRKNGTYTALPKEPQLFKGIKAANINGRKMYPYKAMLAAMGYSTKSSSSTRRHRYPGHFVLQNNLLLITEEFALHLYHSKQVVNNRVALKNMQPVLPFNFGEPIIGISQKGGAAL